MIEIRSLYNRIFQYFSRLWPIFQQCFSCQSFQTLSHMSSTQVKYRQIFFSLSLPTIAHDYWSKLKINIRRLDTCSNYLRVEDEEEEEKRKVNEKERFLFTIRQSFIDFSLRALFSRINDYFACFFLSFHMTEFRCVTYWRALSLVYYEEVASTGTQRRRSACNAPPLVVIISSISFFSLSFRLIIFINISDIIIDLLIKTNARETFVS